ncbi:hypothetical protein ACMX25_31550 [Caballeronia sp. 15715]|uniref:hypothetical protein n=1 Tax=Caballeronia sp. 15715 TaxID=3391030 RepID=UPI0039E59740
MTLNSTLRNESSIRQEMAFGLEGEAKVSELVVGLYQEKVTYGEFAQRRYAIGRAAMDAGRQYREARMTQDRERQLQEQQLASSPTV